MGELVISGDLITNFTTTCRDIYPKDGRFLRLRDRVENQNGDPSPRPPDQHRQGIEE